MTRPAKAKPAINIRLKPDELISVKRQFVALYQKGYSYKQISEMLGVSPGTFGFWLKRFSVLGEKFFSPRPTKKPTYECSRPRNTNTRKLSIDEQSDYLLNLVEHAPEELDPGWLLWDRYSLDFLLRRGFDIMPTGGAPDKALTLPIILPKIGLSLPEELKTRFPTLLNPAQRRDYLELLKRTVPVGIQIVLVSLDQLSENMPWQMLSVRSKLNTLRFLLFQGTPTPEQWIDFFERSLALYDRQLAAIANDLPVFKAPQMVEWLKHNTDRFWLYIKTSGAITPHTFD